MTKAITRCRSIEVVVPKEQKSFRQKCEENRNTLLDWRSKLLAEVAKLDKELRQTGALIERLDAGEKTSPNKSKSDKQRFEDKRLELQDRRQQLGTAHVALYLERKSRRVKDKGLEDAYDRVIRESVEVDRTLRHLDLVAHNMQGRW